MTDDNNERQRHLQRLIKLQTHNENDDANNWRTLTMTNKMTTKLSKMITMIISSIVTMTRSMINIIATNMSKTITMRISSVMTTSDTAIDQHNSNENLKDINNHNVKYDDNENDIDHE